MSLLFLTPQNSPANITAQLDFLKSLLASSAATYDVVIGHHPLAGGAATVYGFDGATLYGAGFGPDGSSSDLGRKDEAGKPAFARVSERQGQGGGTGACRVCQVL